MAEESEPQPLNKLISNWKVLCLIFKSTLAMGCLFMPYEFARIGLVPATALSILVALYTFYSIQNQFKIKQEFGDKMGFKFMAFGYAAKAAMPRNRLTKVIRITHDILLLLLNVLTCCSYTYLISVIASLFVRQQIHYRLFVIILILPAMIFYQIRNFRILTYCVLVAIVLSVIAYCVLIVDLISKVHRSSVNDLKNLLARDYYGIPVFLATNVYSISPISVVECIESVMLNSKKLYEWNGYLSISIAVTVATSICLGCLGAVVFQDEAKFILLEHYILNDVCHYLIFILLFIAISITTAIYFNVVFQIVWAHIFEGLFGLNEELEAEAAVRALLIIVIYIITIFWSHLDAIVPMIGAFCSIPLTFLYPYILELILVWPDMKNYSKWRLVKIILLMTFGSVFYILTMTYCILQCYQHLTKF